MQAFHVNGPAIVYVGAQGPTGGALSQLGVTEDGVEGTIQHDYEELKTDVSGPAHPAELQDMGEGASFRIRMIVWDQTIMRSIRADEATGAGLGALAEGLAAQRGQLVFGNDNGFRLVIASNLDEPWRFYYCVCAGSQAFRVGTRATRWDLAIRAIAYIPPTATTAQNIPWFDHIAA